jgi:hypothetical protein
MFISIGTQLALFGSIELQAQYSAPAMACFSRDSMTQRSMLKEGIPARCNVEQRQCKPIPQREKQAMESCIFRVDQHRLGRSSELDLDTSPETDGLPEPESWQLEDFEDIVPHDPGTFEADYDSNVAYCY